MDVKLILYFFSPVTLLGCALSLSLVIERIGIRDTPTHQRRKVGT